MPGKLLNLTFHSVGVLAGEDLRFKEAAIASGLVTGDAMDEIGGGNGPKPFFDANKDKLLHPPKVKEPSGVDIATRAHCIDTAEYIGQRAGAKVTATLAGELLSEAPASSRIRKQHHVSRAGEDLLLIRERKVVVGRNSTGERDIVRAERPFHLHEEWVATSRSVRHGFHE